MRPKILVKILKWFGLLSWVAAFSCSSEIPSEVREALGELPDEIDYNFHVKPILSDRCFVCHGNDQGNLKAELRLDLAESAYHELSDNPGEYAIVPGESSNSRLVYRILQDDPEMVMPPVETNLSLSPYEKAILIRWIDQGAEYKKHWAFTKPEKASRPVT